jgi:hypothetical protein
MNAKLTILKDGKPIFKYPVVVSDPSDFEQHARDCLAHFAQRHPNISLLDDNIFLKFDKD